jgi:multidrug efflux system membrane fusion protein
MNKSDHPAAPTGLEQPRGTKGATHKRAIFGKILGWGFVVSAILLGALAARNMLIHPRSGTGSKIAANAIGIAPRVSGPIKSLPLQDDQAVKQGDVLFEIDPEPYELAARVARANRDAIAGEILNIERTIAAQKANVLAAQAVLAQAETARTQAEDSLRRVEPLLAKNYATADSVEKARNARDTAVAAVNAAQAQLSAAEFAVQDIAPLQAKLKATEAALAEAELSVRDCTVRAPFDGRVAGLNISVGAFARTAIDVLTLIDTGDWHVEANFRESELGRIQAGDRAEVQIMTAPGRTFAGEVESVSSGVSELPKLPYSGLPVVKRELDWVRLAQDFPVRIRFTESVPPDLLRVGATVTATIFTRSRDETR